MRKYKKPKDMSDIEFFRIKAQRAVLAEVAKDYPGRTIENIIQNMDAIIGVKSKQKS